MRKVIQLSQTPTPTGGYRLFALCDDGTIFCLVPSSGGHPGYGWERMPDVPQDKRG